MKQLTYKPRCGDSIFHAASHVSNLAKTSRRIVRFKFNDTPLFASPKKSPHTLLWEFEMIRGQQGERYRMSEAGQLYRSKRAAQISRRQNAVTAAIRGLPGLIENNNMDHLMGWIHSFADHADDKEVNIDAAAGLTHGGHEWIALLFESKGYRQNQHVYESHEWFNTRQRMGEYIIGQVIAHLRMGMPPHPVVRSFITDHYFKIPAS